MKRPRVESGSKGLAVHPELERALCDYCGAPLPPESDGEQGASRRPRYCCYGCRVLGEAGQRPLEVPREKSSPWFRIAVGAVLSGQAMLLDLAVNLTPPSGVTRTVLHAALFLSSVAAIFILGGPLLRSALEELRARHVSIELLFLAGIGGAFGTSVYSTLTGVGAAYYEVVSVLVTVYAVGKTLGAESRARAIRETRQLADTFDRCRRVRPDGSEEWVPAVAASPGDIVRILAGEPVPVDGRIESGQAFVCETPLTGEPFPVVRRAGDLVYAGSYSEDGELRVAVTAGGHARRLDLLLAALETARAMPSRLQTQADRLVKWFLPVVLTVSLATFVFWGLRSGWESGLFNGLAVLLVACPCAMGLATPLALWSGLAALAARGFVARSADTLERLARLNRVVFDKTGTLSEERCVLVDLASQGTPADRAQLMALLRAVQRTSSHPVARAFAPADHEPAPPPNNHAFEVCSLKSLPALGVEAWVRSGGGTEQHVRVGRRELMSELAAEDELLASLARPGDEQLVYVEVDGRLRALAAVREKLRASTLEAMRALQQQNIACTVMTGDRVEHAQLLLPSGALEGGLTPEAKAGRVSRLQEQGCRVGFVGDGVNDAPALRRADVGIALAHGAGVTTANADAVLYGGDLRVVPWAVALSRRVRNSIRSNLMFAAGYNLIGMALAASGLLHPVAAALLMVLSSFTVSWRAMRSTQDGGPCCVGPAPGGRGERVPAAGKTPAATNQEAPAGAAQGVPRQLAYAGLLAAQAPFLIYFGQLGLTCSVTLVVVMLALAAGVARFRSRNPEWQRLASMAFAMLGVGNWGMLLGWWADSGFAPLAATLPSCCSPHFGLSAPLQMPWMNLGMLALGLPPMLLDDRTSSTWKSRLLYAFLAAVGMLWGMSFGDHVLTTWLGSVVSQRFLLSFIGMVIGMLLGMFLLCEFARALWPSLKRRPVR